MITKDHLIYDILSEGRGGHISDDESFTPEQVGFWVDITRAQLIKQTVDKGKSINPDIIQTLTCLDVIQADASECPECVTTGCFITRTKLTIPNTIETQNKNLITRAGSMLIGSPAFTFMSYERAIWTGHNKFTKDIPKAFLRNGYMYFISKKFINKVIVSGVFEFPEDAANYASCDGEPCYSKTSPYPISAYMINILKDIIKQKDLGFGLATQSDNSNNANSELEKQNAAPTQRRRSS